MEADHAALLDLRQGLKHLDPTSRLTLVLRYYLDLPFDEVAGILRCSTYAAKLRTRRALAKLSIDKATSEVLP